MSHARDYSRPAAAGSDDDRVAYFTYPTICAGSLVMAAEYAKQEPVRGGGKPTRLSGGVGSSASSGMGVYFTLPDSGALDGGSGGRTGDDLFAEDDYGDYDRGTFLYGGETHGKSCEKPAGASAMRGGASAMHGGASAMHGGASAMRGGASAMRGGGASSVMRGGSASVEAAVGAAGQLYFTVPVQGGDDDGDDDDGFFGG